MTTIPPCSACDPSFNCWNGAVPCRKYPPRDAEVQRLRAALTAALPILDLNAEEERAFWGAEDKHGIAKEAERIYAQACAALAENEESP